VIVDPCGDRGRDRSGIVEERVTFLRSDLPRGDQVPDDVEAPGEEDGKGRVVARMGSASADWR
jgi:hypothetical protein